MATFLQIKVNIEKAQWGGAGVCAPVQVSYWTRGSTVTMMLTVGQKMN